MPPDLASAQPDLLPQTGCTPWGAAVSFPAPELLSINTAADEIDPVVSWDGLTLDGCALVFGRDSGPVGGQGLYLARVQRAR